MKKNFRQIFWISLGIFILSWVLTEILLYSHNILLRNHHWHLVKRDKILGVMGSDSFLLDRSVLAGNRLNLGQWYGYQEIHTTEKYQASELSFDMEFKKNSQLDILLDFFDGKSRALRIHHSEMNALYYEANSDHFFTLKKLTDIKPFKLDKLHLKLNFLEDNILVNVNGSKVGELKFKRSSEPMVLGFKSGPLPVFIDNVVIKNNDDILMADDFKNKNNYFRQYLHHLSGLIFLLILMFAFSRRGVRIFQIFLPSMIMMTLTYFLFDFYHYSHIPSMSNVKMLNKKDDAPVPFLEEKRNKVFQLWGELGGINSHFRKLFKEQGYPMDRYWYGPFYCENDICSRVSLEELKKILSQEGNCPLSVFMGSSFTAGMGSSSLDKSFFAMTYRSLAPRIDVCQRYLNLAYSGFRLFQLTEKYREILKLATPRRLILVSGSNDGMEYFEKSLRELVQINLDNNIEVNLVLEANSTDFNDRLSGLSERHLVMRELARENNLNLIDLHGHLASELKKRNGYIWWDFVHMTDYGQILTSDFLSLKLEP